MDLVKIGFLIQTSGLEKANKEVDSLLDKTGKIGTVSKKSATEVEASQKKAKKATEETTKAVEKNTKAVEKGSKEADKAKNAVERTTKALEKQKIVGEYLSKGLDKSTATSLANFRQLKASVVDTNTMFTLLGNNSSLNKANIQAKAVNDSLNKMRLNLDLVGKGFSASEQAQIRQLKAAGASNAELEKAIELIKKRKQAEVLANYQNQKASLSREWMSAYDKEIEARVAKEKEAAAKIQQVRDTVNDYEARSKRSFGGGILDQVEAENKELLQLRKKYTDEVNAIADKEAREAEVRRVREMQARQNEYQKAQADAEKARQERFSAEQKQYQKDMDTLKKSQDEQEAIRQRAMKQRQDEYQANMALLDKEREKVKQANAERQKTIALEQTKAKYINEGFGKGSATQLAKMELSGADQTTLDKYKASLLATASALDSFADSAEKATEEKSKLAEQIRGIAFYAVLSTAIYGVMTAMTNLASATVRMADEYTAIQNRMKLYINDANTLAAVNRNLGKMSMENNVGLRETATLYTRLAPALQKLGGNAATVTAVVDAFGKSMRIGGATAMEAASATVQFSQAMASGKLAGDEFRSISEASPRFLKAIADGSGIATESLKKLSSEGFLTTALVARALLKEYPTLIEENKKLGVTLEQGANAFKTAFLMAVGELNEGAKVTESVGNALMGVARSLSNFAQTARETGTEVRATFERYLPVIKAVGEVLGFVAVVAVSKFVASMVVAGVSATAAMLKANTGVVGLIRSLGVANAAAFGLATTMARLSSVGNLATLGLTVAGVAASYLLFRDNAAEANEKLVEQNEYAEMTTEAFRKLNTEKQKNALFDLEQKAVEANKNLMKSYKDVINVLKDYHREQTRGLVFDKNSGNVAQIIREVEAGTMSFETATRQLAEMKVPDSVIKSMRSTTDVYIGAAKAANQVIEPARRFGSTVKLAGNEAQNASPAIRGMTNDVDDLGTASLNTADAFTEMANRFRDGVADIKTTLKVMQSYNLDKGIAQQLIKESQGAAKQHPAIVNAYTAINKSHEKDIIKLGANPDKKRLEEVNKFYGDLKKSVEANEKRIAESIMAKGAPYAQELQAWTNKENDFTSSRNKQSSSSSSSGDVNGYNDQLAFAKQYLSLIRQGVDVDVAKIAATKEYAKWYGTNLDMAKQMAAVEKERANIEKQIQEAEQARAAKDQGLRDVVKDLERMKTVSKFINEGFIPSVANKAAGLGFTSNDEGVLYAQKATTLALEEQVGALRDSAIEKRNLYELTRSGQTLEEAQLDNMLYTNKHLLPEQLTLLKQIKELNNLDRRAETMLKVSNDANAMLREAANYATMQDNSLGEIANRYDKINKSEVIHLNTWKDIVQAVKDYNDYLVNQKANPLGDFSGIDFDVFGDFGNPFKSALDGLNLLLGGADALKEKYDQQYAALDQQMKEAAGNEDTLAKIKLTRATLEEKQIVDQGKLQHQQITSALSLTKSLFKEESKGYKVISGLEKAYQAGVIAFKLWEKKDEIAFLALKLKAHVTDALGFTTGAAAKLAAQSAVNVAKGTEAVLTQGSGDPYTAIPRMAAMAALVAGLGIVIGSISGGSSAPVIPTNEGTGTVFGDPTAQSESIKKSIDLLAENSDVTLPLTAAMLKSLQNIENNIGGLANLLIRNPTGSKLLEGVNVGFIQNSIGKGIVKGFDIFNKATFGFADKLTLGLFSSIGKALGGLFGKKVSVQGQGLYGGSQKLSNVVGNGFSLQEYVDIRTKKKTLGITTSDKTSTRYDKASQELSNQFTLIFKGFNDAILATAPMLGKSTDEVAKKLNNFVINIGRVDLQGLSGEQIQEKLNAVFGAEADRMARRAVSGLDDFQKVGEGYFETLMRVANSIEMASVYTDKLNVSAIKYTDILNKQGDVATEILRQSVLNDEYARTAQITTKRFRTIFGHLSLAITTSSKNIVGGFYDMVSSFDGTVDELYSFVNQLRDLQDQLHMTGKNADYLTRSMIVGAGGTDQLERGFEAYFEMMTKQEQAAELTRRLSKEFAVLGQALPADVEAFRNLLSSINITTEAGQKLYGQIIALAPEFTDLQDALDVVKNEAKSAADEAKKLADEAKKLADEFEAMMVKLRQAIYITGQSASNITQAMIDAAGGGDALLKGLEAVYGMLTPAEKATELTRRMSLAFGELGVALPASNEAFRELIGGLKTSTKAGQELFGKLVVLAPEFVTLQGALATAADELAKAQADAEAAAKAAAEAAEEQRKLREELEKLVKEGQKYAERLRITAVAYDQVTNKAGEANTEILRTSMLLALGSAKVSGGFYDLVKAFDGSASELFDFIVSMRDVEDAIFVTKQSFKNVTEAMLKGTDGIDNLANALSSYFDLLTPAEQAAELTRRMAKEFGTLGLQMPTSIEGFRKLVEGINTNTAAGQELFGRLILLTEEFAELQGRLDEIAQVAKEAQDALNGLKQAYFITGQSISSLTQAMIDAAGGTDVMQTGLEAMFDMLSPTEQATELTRRLTKQFSALGLQLPENVQGFRDLVKGMDTSTVTGQKLLGEVIALAPEFNTLQDALESANSEVIQLVESLRDLADQARQARGETDQPRNLDYARAMFESTAMLAMQGDTEAANKLMSLGTNLMDLSKQYSVDGSEYARDLAWIQRAATVSADVQEAGLGYTSSTLSTTLSGGSVTPTVSTTSTSTDAKLDVLREDLNAALYAIAKYTQSTSDRLGNWDDGNRIMVGIQPENGDRPVPVVVTP